MVWLKIDFIILYIFFKPWSSSSHLEVILTHLPQGIWLCLETVLVVSLAEGVSLVSCEYRPGMHLKILRRSSSPPQEYMEITWSWKHWSSCKKKHYLNLGRASWKYCHQLPSVLFWGSFLLRECDRGRLTLSTSCPLASKSPVGAFILSH